MMNIVTGIIGIASVFAFLGILLWWVKATPLIIITALVMALLLVDFVQSLRSNGDGSKS